ncbi:MAG: metal ABC transporter permease [Campylobacter sp.]|nr:metal ABC transporter permease [Campylobacter sp.]
MSEILSLNFMQNALAAGVLVSIVCAITGSLVVINRMTFIAGGIAHGAYGGIGIAFFFSLEPLLGACLFSLLLALVIATLTLRDKSKIDSVIGAIWAFGMAIGIIFIDLTPGYNADLMSYLFGSILAVSSGDLLFMGAIDVVFIALIGLFYRQFTALSFDAEFAKLRGVNTTLFYYVLVCMMALCVVATIRVVGLILVIALLTIPPYIAQIFAKRLGSMMAISALFSIIFCVSGLMLSFELNLTGGASIILIASVCFFIFCFRFKNLIGG